MASCRCKNPPGGGVECSPGQVALCQVIDGECQSSCEDTPWGSAREVSRLECANWVLSLVSGQVRRPDMPLSLRDLVVLVAGRYQDAENDIDARFQLPRDIQLRIAPLISRDEDRGRERY